MLFQLYAEVSDIGKCFVKLLLIRAAAAQLKYEISCRTYGFRRHLQQFQADGVNALSAHTGRQYEAPEPVEKVVGKGMDLQPVGIDHPGGTAHGGEIESVFSFLDEVFHLPSAAIELYDLVGFHLQSGNDEGIQMSELVLWLLDLENDPAGL